MSRDGCRRDNTRPRTFRFSRKVRPRVSIWRRGNSRSTTARGLLRAGLGWSSGPAADDLARGHPLRHQVVSWTRRGQGHHRRLLRSRHRAADRFLLAESHDDYDTNLPVADLVGGQAMVATRFAGAPIEAEHGGPARLLVPHLYFWKSAKWIKGLRFTVSDEAGFWELRGYHMYGDPWREQRYTNDP